MRLIDADALGVGRCKPELFTDRKYAAGWNGVVNIIDKAPTIDATPVTLGRWNGWTTSAYLGGLNELGEPRMAGRKFYRCSNCRRGTAVKTNFCPNCGAKMEV